MTPLRGQANVPVMSNILGRLEREPERVPQVAEALNHDQRELDHIMRCTKVGCTRCGC